MMRTGWRVTDRVLLSARRHNLASCVELASAHGLGIELMEFAYPDLLDGDWRSAVAEAKALVDSVPGMITLHGPFLDMAPGSPDPQVNALVASRYKHALNIAAEVGAQIVIFHANFIGSLRNEDYRRGWHERNVHFWRKIAAYAEECGVMVAVENMWEFDPEIIGDVLTEIDHPYLRACLDVGHAHLFSHVGFDTWLNVLGRWIIHTHLNNNAGVIDEHHGLADGVLTYPPLLDKLRSLPNHPSFTLEMDNLDDMRASLQYFRLRAEN
jgi:sugar phosphate isomerase/epimerase